jgi:uncharacterized membrane protein YfcA
VVLIPLLTVLFGVDIRYAMGASVVATSPGAAAVYVKEGVSNIRIGMFLEVVTTLGAFGGAFLATRISTHALAVVLGLVLLGSAYLSRKARSRQERDVPLDPLATRLRMNGTLPEAEGVRHYNVTNVPLGFTLMLGAGAYDLNVSRLQSEGAVRIRPSGTRLVKIR